MRDDVRLQSAKPEIRRGVVMDDRAFQAASWLHTRGGCHVRPLWGPPSEMRSRTSMGTSGSMGLGTVLRADMLHELVTCPPQIDPSILVGSI